MLLPEIVSLRLHKIWAAERRVPLVFVRFLALLILANLSDGYPRNATVRLDCIQPESELRRTLCPISLHAAPCIKV